MNVQRRRRQDPRTLALYTFVLLREFKWTFAILAALIVSGAALHLIAPEAPSPFTALYGAWMMLFAQPIVNPPKTWYLQVAAGVYPLLGVMFIGEGIVRFALLMMSRRRGEKEWMKVKASTYRDHIVLCGLGHLGYRVLQQLIALDKQVVCIEKNGGGLFTEEAKASGVPVLVRDMKDDQTLIDAGVPHAHTILIATNDDMANVEVALDARRMNPRIRVSMRQYDQKLAHKFRDAFAIDFAFSSSALAAATVAATSLRCRVVAAYDVAGKPHVLAELLVAGASGLQGRSVADVEAEHGARVMCRTPGGGGAAESPPAAKAVLAGGDMVLVHAEFHAMDRLATLAHAEKVA